MSPLRFCMVTTFYPPGNFGGDGIDVQRLSQALARQGHEVTVLQAADAYDVLNGGAARDEPPTRDGVEVVRVKSSTPRLSVLAMQQSGRPLLAGRALARILDQRSFDVINYHNVSLAGGPGILAHGRGIKLYTAHEHWLVCPTHTLWRHNRELCTGRQCVRCSLHYHRPPQAWRRTGMLERQCRHVDAFIAQSEFSRRKHREFGFARDMEVINCFLPDAAGADKPGPSPHARPFFLFVGRLERIKGLDDVIPLFRDNLDADLLVIGDGEHAEVLRRLADGCDRIRFLGRLAPEALDAYYRHALSLIVPSVCYETFGMVLIESFRQGTPVLARRTGPFPELVERSGGGLLFDGPTDLAAALRAVQGEPALRARLAAAARDGFARHWSERVVIGQYLELVARLQRQRSGMAQAL